MASSTLVATFGTISISLPVSGTDTVAQSALNALISQVGSGSLNIQSYNPSATVQGVSVPVTTSVTVAQSVTSGGVVSTVAATQVVTVANAIAVGSIGATTVTAPGGGVSTVGGLANLGVLTGSNAEVINTDTSGGTMAAISSTVPGTTLIAGANSNTAYINRSSSGSVVLAGGNTYVGNYDAGTTTNISLGGSGATVSANGAPGYDGAAYVDASVGTANVTVGNYGLLNVNTGSNATVNIAVQSNAYIAISAPTGAATVSAVATITGASTFGSQIDYIPNGGNAFINPNDSNVVILAGNGSETLAGGLGTTTVFSGTGVFTSGRGNAGTANFMSTSTVDGVTTLIGGGIGAETLVAQAGGDLLQAGAGIDLLFAAGSSTLGNSFITGSGRSTVFGGAVGGNTIQLGTGSASVYGGHASVNTAGNIYQLYGAGGSDTIADFVIGTDVFRLSTGYIGNSGLNPAGVRGFVAAGQNLVATLSDGTTITFVNDGNAVANNSTTRIFT